MKKLAIGLAVFCAAILVGGPASAVDYQKFTITAAVGGSFPVRSAEFVDASQGVAFYRYVTGEYDINERLSLGGQYSGADFDLENGGELSATDLGAFALVWFDLIPENHWNLFLKLGGTKSDVEGASTPPQWQVLGGIGAQFYAKGNVKARFGVDFHDVLDLGPSNAESKTNTGNEWGSQIGAVFVYLGLNFAPFDLKL